MHSSYLHLNPSFNLMKYSFTRVDSVGGGGFAESRSKPGFTFKLATRNALRSSKDPCAQQEREQERHCERDLSVDVHDCCVSVWGDHVGLFGR